jgi:pimeloyl-[acyl-carrier protein] methyl ester esterase
MRKVLLAACVAALALYGPARAAGADPNRLFPDSRLVVKDRISVEVVGQGPDLVLIPGLASSRETWKAAAERLKGRYRLHLIQVAGFAGEPARANASGEVVAPTEEAIDAYIREQKLGPATVIGHSLGGTITLLLAMAGPMATPANMQAGAAKARDQILAATPEQFRASSAGQMVGMVSDPAMREKITGWSIASDRSVMARAMYEDLQLDLRPELGKISTPITLLYPDYTPVGAPPGSMTQMYPPAFAPAATIKPVQVEHSLHFIMLDQPAVFDKALDEFLAH